MKQTYDEVRNILIGTKSLYSRRRTQRTHSDELILNTVTNSYTHALRTTLTHEDECDILTRTNIT